MSSAPGIGAKAMDHVAATLNSPAGAKVIARLGDVPTLLQNGRHRFPLGRYLANRLRDNLGIEDPPGKAQAIALRKEELRELRKSSGLSAKAFSWSKPFVEWQRIANIEARASLKPSKGKL